MFFPAILQRFVQNLLSILAILLSTILEYCWSGLFPKYQNRSLVVAAVARVHLIDNWWFNHKIKRRVWRIPQLCNYIHGKYGSLAEMQLLGQRTLIVTDLSTAKKLMTAHGHVLKQRFGNVLGLQSLNMQETGLIWNNDVTAWKRNRAIFEATLNKGCKKVEALSSAYFERLSACAGLEIGTPTSLLSLVRNYTLAMTMEGLFEIEMRTDATSNCEENWSEEAKETVANYFKAWEFFLLTPPPPPPESSQSSAKAEAEIEESRNHQAACSKMLQFSASICKMSQVEGSSSSSHFIQKISKFNNQNELHQCVSEMLLAGTDTSSLTMFYTLLYLADYPEIGNKLSRLITNSTSAASDDDVELAITRLYYESMRLIPVGPVILRQCEEDIHLDLDRFHGDDDDDDDSKISSAASQLHLKKGDGIIFNIAGMNRLPTIYSNPDEFNPSRFQFEPFPLSFGTGKKSCVGKAFAEKEIKLFFKWFLSKYTVVGNHGSSGSTVSQLETRWDIANAPTADIQLTVFPRKLVFLTGQNGLSGTTALLQAIQAQYPKLKVHFQSSRENIEDLATDATKTDEHDLQLELIKLRLELLTKFENQFAIIEGSVLDCLVDLTGNLKENLNNLDILSEKELFSRMKPHWVIYFPFCQSKIGGQNTRADQDFDAEDFEYLTVLKRSGCKYHCLKSELISQRLVEIMDFIRSNSNRWPA